MLLATAKQMQLADRRTIEDIGLPGMVLMENAAQGAARVIQEKVGEPRGLRVAALCGRGNNGGDGMAILRILANQGAQATAYLLCRQDQLQGDAALNLGVAKACGVKIVETPDEKTLTRKQAQMIDHHIYVDALLGTGLNSPVKGPYALAIEFLNSLERPVLAVDIPSGLCADTGRPLGLAVVADWTVTFGLLKLGLALDPGDYVGELTCVDISIPPRVVEELDIRCRLLDEDLVESLLLPRLPGSHKGTFGHLMVLGGSPGKTGAACLAAQGGLRGGAGLITLGLPRDLNLAAEISLTAVMSQPLPQNSEGCLSPEALPVLLDMLATRQALVLGPGLSTQKDSLELARQLMEHASLPLVVDADGLNALANNQGGLKFASPETVITPHPGEAARLLVCTSDDIQNNRPEAARRLAGEYGAVAVLKGARTLVADPGGNLWVNPTGNPLLASGGTGDVLSGLIGGLLAQGMGALESSLAGVFVHGLAADLAAADYGLRGLAAEELIDYLPAAFAALEGCVEDQDNE